MRPTPAWPTWSTLSKITAATEGLNMIINIAEAKAHLSSIVERACNGEHITIAKNNLPLVDLIPHHRPTKRKLGIAKGLIDYQEDIFNTDEADIERFYQSKLEP